MRFYFDIDDKNLEAIKEVFVYHDNHPEEDVFTFRDKLSVEFNYFINLSEVRNQFISQIAANVARQMRTEKIGE